MDESDRHPSDLQLRAYAQGRLESEDHQTEVEQHLADCERCRSEVETAPLDGFTIKLKGVVTSPIRSLDTVISGYEILEELGRGGMGVVYRAKQLSLNRIVAVKRLQTSHFETDEQRIRFRNEAELLAQLQHPRIVQVLDFGESQGQPFLAMEYIQGMTLNEVIRIAPLDIRDASIIIEALARAMEFAHQKGVVHRDLKPMNVLLAHPEQLENEHSQQESGDKGNDGEVPGDPRIVDFGLARQLNAAAQHTQTGAIVGTPNYLAPEQVDGDPAKLTAAADIHSLGATLYECLTGRPPFGGSLLETLDQVRSLEPTPPARLRPRVPQDLQTICLKCLAKNPAQRYASAAELADDLRRFLEGRPIKAVPPSVWEISRSWTRRHPARAGLIATLVLATIGGALGITVHNSRLRAEIKRTLDQERETARQRVRAETNYRMARQALRNVVRKAEAAPHGQIPEMWKLIENQAQEAIAFFSDQSRTENPDAVDLLHDLAEIYMLRGNVQTSLGRDKQAFESFEQARDAAMAAVDRQADEHSRGLLAASLTKLGFVLMGDPQRHHEAESNLNESLKLFRALSEENPENLQRPVDVAWCLHNLGTLIRTSSQETAIDHFQEAIKICLESAERIPERRAELLARAADSSTNLGLIQWQNGDLLQADATFENVESIYNDYLDENPNEEHSILALAAVYVNWGNVAASLGELTRAVELCSKGIIRTQTLFESEPDGVVVRDQVFKLHGVRAQCLMALNDFSKALEDWRFMLPLSPNETFRTMCLTQTAICLVRTGAHAEPARIARQLSKQQLTANDLYNVACIFSLASRAAENDQGVAARAAVAHGYRMEAIALIEQLDIAGYFDDPARIIHANRDPDLKPLHDDVEFRKLIPAQ